MRASPSEHLETPTPYAVNLSPLSRASSVSKIDPLTTLPYDII